MKRSLIITNAFSGLCYPGRFCCCPYWQSWLMLSIMSCNYELHSKHPWVGLLWTYWYRKHIKLVDGLGWGADCQSKNRSFCHQLTEWAVPFLWDSPLFFLPYNEDNGPWILALRWGLNKLAFGAVPNLVNEQSILVIIDKYERIAHIIESPFISKMNLWKMLQSLRSVWSLCKLFLNTH